MPQVRLFPLPMRKVTAQPCPVCGKSPCECEKEPCPICGQRPCICKKKAKVKLADGKERTIQYMMCTTFWLMTAPPCLRNSSWNCYLGSCQISSRAKRNSAQSGAHPIPARSFWEDSPKKGSVTINWPRCKKLSMPKKAISLMCWHMWLTPTTADPHGSGRYGQGCN